MLDFNFFFLISQVSEIQKYENLCANPKPICCPNPSAHSQQVVCPPVLDHLRRQESPVMWNHQQKRDVDVSEACLLSFVKEKQKSKACVA